MLIVHIVTSHSRPRCLVPWSQHDLLCWKPLCPFLMGMFKTQSHACKICKTGSARVNLRNTEGISLNCVYFHFDNTFTERSVMGWSVFLLCLAQDSPQWLRWMSLPYRETPSGRLRLYSTMYNHDKNKDLATSCHPHGHANMQTSYHPPHTLACTSTWTLMGKVLGEQPPHACTHRQ